jgi:hypothetical protein
MAINDIKKITALFMELAKRMMNPNEFITNLSQRRTS